MTDTTGDSSSDKADHRGGDTLRDGRFVITGKLGEGGQASTFDGVDKRDGRRITLKRFRVRGASSWKEVELAEREAKVLAQISHRALPVYVDHFEEHGSLYLVTEHIEGDTLARLRDRGPISEREVLRFLADSAEALDYLRGRSPPLVHRDIKPSNVIRRPDGSFAIIDFGAVRDRLKVTGSTVVGTFGFMAPEQFQGRAMPQSDVYAVGTTAIAMLTGRDPEDLPHKGLAIDVAASLPAGRPALIRALAAMTEPDPDRRATSITPLLAELAPSPSGPPRDPKRATPPSPFESRGRRPPSPADFIPAPDLHRDVERAGEEVGRVAAEIGETFLRVVEEVSRQSSHDLRREAKRAAEIARREAKRVMKEAKRGGRAEDARERAEGRRDRARELAEEARERARDDRRRRSLARGPRPPGAPLGGPILLIVWLTLTIAQLAVTLALRVITPVVLFVVSLLFFGSIPGRAMRRAATAVSDAGRRAVAAIGRAKDVVGGRAPSPDADTQVRIVQEPHVDPHGATHISTVDKHPAPGARIDADATSAPRARIDDDPASADAAEEEAAAEAEHEADRPRRAR
ncbi:MAG: protein kinase [Polyangiaceae bacterium]